MTEIWKPVVGYEDLYLVSNLGQVKRRGCENPLKPYIGKQGYAYVSPSKNNLKVKINIAYLVTDAFLGLLPKGMTRNHKNGNKADNRLENLEYITQQENVRHAFALGLAPTGDAHYSRKQPERLARGERSAKSLLTELDIEQIRHIYATAKISHRNLGRLFGVSGTAIGYIVNRKAWTHVA